jgi:GT2 family glycosyltransferase
MTAALPEIACDLVLLSWNHLEETTPCLETLFRHTDVPCRLFIVDNGSEAPVREFLASVKPQGAIREVTLLQHETNEGFPRGMNRGLRATTAPTVCILNNDLLFTPQWLSRLLAVARAVPELGVLNPASSTFGQHPPRGMALDAYAQQLQAQGLRWVEVGMCIGFCMLITRPVIDRIGYLTEEVERIFFEDEDYCMRAQQAGFRCGVAEASYVYHHEHRTVKRMGERERIFQANRRWCEQRWGPWRRVAVPHFAPLAAGSPDTRRRLAQWIELARRRTHLYVYAPIAAGLSDDALFESVGLVPHRDVQFRRIPAWGAAPAAAWGILLRRKKRFDAILAPDAAWGGLMRRLTWAHGAPILHPDDPTLVANACLRP